MHNLSRALYAVRLWAFIEMLTDARKAWLPIPQKPSVMDFGPVSSDRLLAASLQSEAYLRLQLAWVYPR